MASETGGALEEEPSAPPSFLGSLRQSFTESLDSLSKFAILLPRRQKATLDPDKPNADAGPPGFCVQRRKSSGWFGRVEKAPPGGDEGGGDGGGGEGSGDGGGGGGR